MKVRIPNCLTVLRFFATAALLFLTPFSIPFYCVYAACGVLDYLDGFAARALKAESDIGYKLDHIASIAFVIVSTVSFFKEVPALKWVLFWACGIILVKLISLVFGAVRFRTAPFINTNLNKVAKAAFFLFPLWLWFAGMYFAYITVLVFLSLACVEELIINLSSKEFDRNRAYLFKLKKKSKKK